MIKIFNISKASCAYFILFGFLFWHFAKEMLQIRLDGWYVGQVNLYGDLVYHLALINKFLTNSNISIDNPIFTGSKIDYPIFADYITYLIAKATGVDFALFITTIAGGIVTLITIRLFIKTFTKSDNIVFLSALLFFLNGGFGFYYFFQDYALSQKPFLEFILSLPREYTDLKNLGYWWINSYLAYFIPQRGFLFAFPITITVLILLYRGFKKTEMKNFALAGILAGTLPLVQAHSLFLLCLLCIFYAPLSLYKNKQFRLMFINWSLFAAITGIVAIPLFKAITSVSNPLDYVRHDPGWTSDENIVWFWIKNLGIFGPMLLLSLVWLLKQLKLFVLYLPFLLIFIISNIWIFQPWEFDNSKLLIYWYFASCIVVAYFLYNTLLTGNLIQKVTGIMLIAVMVLSGSIDILRTFTPITSYQIYSKTDLEIAQQTKLLTPEEAIFATASNHNHPIPTLTGRSTLLGFHGWIWSHGLNYLDRANDVSTIYKGGKSAEELIKKYKINYITVGPQELKEFSINLSYFNQYPKINLAQGWILYDVSTIWTNNSRQN